MKNRKEDKQNGILVVILVILFIMVSIMLTSCATSPSRQFNSHDTEDYSCYKDYNGGIGYCEK